MRPGEPDRPCLAIIPEEECENRVRRVDISERREDEWPGHTSLMYTEPYNVTTGKAIRVVVTVHSGIGEIRGRYACWLC